MIYCEHLTAENECAIYQFLGVIRCEEVCHVCQRSGGYDKPETKACSFKSSRIIKDPTCGCGRLVIKCHHDRHGAYRKVGVQVEQPECNRRSCEFFELNID
jgi:hypothetical protein